MPGKYFNPRPPRGGRPASVPQCGNNGSISIHALREEGDYRQGHAGKYLQNFNPRPPRGGRRMKTVSSTTPLRFQSTPSARRATRHREALILHAVISIHALREEGDTFPVGSMIGIERFQSTPSARRATRIFFIFSAILNYFNPRPPRGGRLLAALRDAKPCKFQSTPSARRATATGASSTIALLDFNPRPPRGGRRSRKDITPQQEMISIHALREEGDCNYYCANWQGCNFNPRPPRGGRLFG